MTKSDVMQQEMEKLHKLFQDVTGPKRELVNGLIEDAAYLYAENWSLKAILEKTGMVKIHPDLPDLQKATEVAKQYLKNVNTYATVIKTLSGILDEREEEDDEDLKEFE